jgi:hypothetical protein
VPEEIVWSWIAAVAVLLAAVRGRLIPAMIVAAIPLAYEAATADVPRTALDTVHQFYGFLPYLEPVSLMILVALALVPND